MPLKIPGPITIPDTVTDIGKDAFSYCTNLTSVTIPASVTSIGDGAFSDCVNLTDMTIPVNLISAGTNVTSSGFSKIVTGYTNLSLILTGTGTINQCAFANCSELTSVIIPEGVTGIGSSAFYGTSLTNVIIPSGTTSIGFGAFYISVLTSVTFNGNNTVISIGTVESVKYDIFPAGESLLTAGGATSDNSYKMSAGTYTRASSTATTWTKQQ